MTSIPLASVIVPSYRGADRLPALLDAFAGQDPAGPAFDVVVVVDGVVDSSPSLLEAEDRFPLRAVVLPDNRGRVAALNAGHVAAEGDILIRCDDDLVPDSDFVRRHVEAHEDGAVPAVLGLCRDLLDPTPYARAYGLEAASRGRRDAYAAPSSRLWRHWAANCSVTRAAWEQVGPYDTGYRAYGWEDVDYGYRLHAAGLDPVLVPELETPHRAAAVTTASRVARAQASGAARRLFEERHPEADLPPAQPALSVWNALVRIASRSPGGPAPAARLLDRLLPMLPLPVGRKLVALGVESAALAGYRNGRSGRGLF